MLPDGRRERRVSDEWAKDDALTALAERQHEIAAGKITKPEARTLGQLRDEYLAYKQGKKRTLAEDVRMLATRLLPAFGPELPVRQLTAPMIAQYERRRSGQVGAGTVRNELTVLRHMLRLGQRWGYLAELPHIQMPKKSKGRDRFLSEDEIARLLDACDGASNPCLGSLIRIAINTGMRKGELLRLTWGRINLSTSTITLYDTKNDEPRAVPINRAVYDALVALEPDPARRHGGLFRTRSGAPWRMVRTSFETALRRAGIRGAVFHDLRHTAASHMVIRGRSLKEVQEVLGHKHFSMTVRYSHLSAAHKLAAVEALEGLTPAARPRSMAHEMAHEDGEASERLVSDRPASVPR
jgi:integrase